MVDWDEPHNPGAMAMADGRLYREEIVRLRAENERLTAERNALRDYAFEATKAITNLTVGGSEFFGKRIGEMYTADLPYCVEHIRVRMGYHKDAMRANARTLAAEARAEKAAEDMRERAAKVAAENYRNHGKTFMTQRARNYEHAGKTIAAAISALPTVQTDTEETRRGPSSAHADVFEWLETELSAIDCWYRGDPSYEHDAYWLKDKALDLVKRARKAALASLPKESADAD